MSEPQLHHFRTTPQLLHRATTTFISPTNHLTFLLLSLLLLSFRFTVETGTYVLTSFIDADPSLHSFLSRLDLRLQRSDAPSHLPRRRHRPFLHLTRVGTLEDDFFSGDDDDRILFGPRRKSHANSSFVSISGFDRVSGFSGYVQDNGIRVSEVVRPGFSFAADKLWFDSNGSRDEFDEGKSGAEKRRTESENQERNIDREMKFLVKGLDLGHRGDSFALFMLVGLLSAAYGWVILWFLVTYSCVHGIVFVSVVNDLLRRYNSIVTTICDGSRLGIRRLSGFILMTWAVRDAVTQLLGLWFFGDIDDQYTIFRLFVRLKLMPFSLMSPRVRGFDKEVGGFLFMWFLTDGIVAFIFSVDSWVAIVTARRSGREILRDGWYLISTMLYQAFQMKCLERILCGSFVRGVLSLLFGNYVALFFQSIAEIYFMVAWLIFYFAARSKEPNPDGSRFGRRDLEGFVQFLR